jgi:hypothetical protein
VSTDISNSITPELPIVHNLSKNINIFLHGDLQPLGQDMVVYDVALAADAVYCITTVSANLIAKL